MAYGRYFEEFEVGAVYKHWPGRTITEFDDTWFSLLTMNQNPLHIDESYAGRTQHGRRLVVGPLVFSVALGMASAEVSGRALATLEYDNIEHLAPTFHGDTIYAETTVLDKQPSQTRPECGIVYVETRAFNQRGETVLTFKHRFLVPRRGRD